MCEDGERIMECDFKFNSSDTVCGTRIPDRCVWWSRHRRCRELSSTWWNTGGNRDEGKGNWTASGGRLRQCNHEIFSTWHKVWKSWAVLFDVNDRYSTVFQTTGLQKCSCKSLWNRSISCIIIKKLFTLKSPNLFRLCIIIFKKTVLLFCAQKCTFLFTFAVVWVQALFSAYNKIHFGCACVVSCINAV